MIINPQKFQNFFERNFVQEYFLQQDGGVKIKN